ncbi:MAG: thiol peroxidase [Desulfobulbaceae bacterium]|nr:thiol peroxidase [Desulfobulbaceae bacterium]
MSQVTLQGNPAETIGDLPAVGSTAPSFSLTKTDLSDCTLQDFSGKTIVLNIFPSIDTPVCAASVRRFNQEASSLDNTVVLCVSADLPFAHQRFCEGEGLEKVIPLSVFRSPDFGKNYGVTITSGPLTGLLCRAIVIMNTANEVIYTELIPEITQEPDYDKALAALK